MDPFLRNTLIDQRTWQTPICPLCKSKTVNIDPLIIEFSCLKRHYSFYRYRTDVDVCSEQRYIGKYNVVFSKASYTINGFTGYQSRIYISTENRDLCNESFNSKSKDFPQLITTTDIENFLILT